MSPRRQFTLNTLYSVAAIGIGLGLYEGRFWPFMGGVLAYVLGSIISGKVGKQ